MSGVVGIHFVDEYRVGIRLFWTSVLSSLCMLCCWFKLCGLLQRFRSGMMKRQRLECATSCSSVKLNFGGSLIRSLAIIRATTKPRCLTIFQMPMAIQFKAMKPRVVKVQGYHQHVEVMILKAHFDGPYFEQIRIFSKVNVCSEKEAFNGVMIVVWTPMLYDDR